MLTKSVAFEIKSIDDGTGEFTGIASTYGGPPDSYGDVVEPGAFAKTLREKGKSRPVLWQHRTSEPIGRCEVTDSPSGLLVTGKLSLALETARTAYTCLKDNLLGGISMGYESLNDRVKDGVRYLTEIKLYEISLVTFPANEASVITSVKSAPRIKKFTAP